MESNICADTNAELPRYKHRRLLISQKNKQLFDCYWTPTGLARCANGNALNTDDTEAFLMSNVKLFPEGALVRLLNKIQCWFESVITTKLWPFEQQEKKKHSCVLLCASFVCVLSAGVCVWTSRNCSPINVRTDRLQAPLLAEFIKTSHS